MEKRIAARIKNQAGMTIAEGLMGLVIVSIVALTSVTAMRTLSKGTKRYVESCRLHNIAVLGRIRSMGVVSDILNFAPLAADRTVPSNWSSYAPFFGETPADRWPNVEIIGQTQRPVIRNSLLISGYMNTLQGIYNSDPVYCTGSKEFPTGTSFEETPTDDFDPHHISTRIKIVPYNIDTGNQVSCIAPPLILMPRPNAPDTDNSSAFNPSGTNEQMARRPNTNSANLGLAVTVITEFKSDLQSSQVESCATEERFQYHKDAGGSSAPEQPEVRLTTTPANIGNENMMCTQRDNNDYTLEIRNPAGTSEPGVVFVCRDRSVMPVGENTSVLPAPGASVLYGIACYTDRTRGSVAPPGSQLGVYIPTNPNYYTYYAPDDEYLGYRYSNSYATGAPGGWVACDLVTLCGRPPRSDSSLFFPNEPSPAVTDRYGYRLRYDNLPSGCRIRLEMATLDTAGNPSPITRSETSPANNSVIRIRAADGGGLWDVPTPRCRTYCGSWPSGYFICNGSC